MLISCETHYSRQRRSTLDPKKLVTLAKEAGYKTIGIADRMSLAGAYEFSQAAQKAEIIPVIGERLPFGTAINHGYITVHALNEAGWYSLVNLNNRFHLDRKGQPLTIDDLIACRDGIFVTTGGLDGPIDAALRENRIEVAEGMLSDLSFAMGNRVAVAFERHDAMDQSDIARERLLADLARDAGMTGLAMTPVRHAGEKDRLGLEVLTFNALGSSVLVGDPAFPAPPYGSDFKSPERMAELFADTPLLVENTAFLASQAHWSVPGAKPHLPRAKNVEDEAAAVVAAAEAGLERRFEQNPSITDHQAYRDRLAFELGHITKLKYSGYFIIVADFIRWCRTNDIPVGPGRGSGAGSLVAWCLEITDIDPIRWGLLFERFINPERVSLPDFDIDFCVRRRGDVIGYVRSYYGDDYVAQIAAYTTMAPRGAFKATARALGIPSAIADSMTKHFPDKAESIDDILAVPTIQDAIVNDVELREALDIAGTLIGVLDSASEHAAGVVISDTSLYETTPLKTAERDADEKGRITQYSMKPVESTGLVKFDFLGLETLSIIQRTWEIVKATHKGPLPFDLDNPPFEDPAVFEMINKGRTLRLFQIENRGMTDALLKIRPNQFEDLIAIVSLYRPGPMDQIPLYADRKAGRVAVEYPHPKLEPVLRETYGIFVYQEQIIEAARVLAGYTLGQADVLRRAIGKKIAEELKAGREGFVSGCEKHSGIPRQDGERLFDIIEKFADYGFNKSHAAAYALICWITACLKHHYPLAFACANLDFDSEDAEKIEEIIRECERMSIAILPPDINLSFANFAIESGKVRYGFRALVGISEATALAIEGSRRGGKFTSASDGVTALMEAGISKTQIVTLIEAGAFDSLLDKATSERRPHLVESVHKMGFVKKSSAPSLFGDDLNNETEIDAARRERARSKKSEPIDLAKEIEAEIRAIGFRLNRHPTAQYQLLGFLIGATGIGMLRQAKTDTDVIMIGLVEGVYEVGERRPEGVGADGVEIIVSDHTGRTRVYAASPENLPEEGDIAVMTVTASRNAKILNSWKTPAAAETDSPPSIVVEISPATPVEKSEDLTNAIKGAIRDHGRGGNYRLVLFFRLADGTAAEIRTLINRVNPTAALVEKLRTIDGITDVLVKS